MAEAGEANLERLRAAYDRWAEGDFSDTELFHPDMEAVWDHSLPDVSVDRGLNEFQASFRSTLDAFGTTSILATRFIPKGDRIAVLATWRGKGRSTDLPMDTEVSHLWTFSGTKAVRVQGFFGDGALEAAGIEQEP
jgi:ketosteroid isomerase-like protein